MSLIPGSGRPHEDGNGTPLQYSCLKNPMDRGAWWATVHGVTKSQTQLSTAQLIHVHTSGCHRCLGTVRAQACGPGAMETKLQSAEFHILPDGAGHGAWSAEILMPDFLASSCARGPSGSAGPADRSLVWSQGLQGSLTPTRGFSTRQSTVVYDLPWSCGGGGGSKLRVTKNIF